MKVQIISVGKAEKSIAALCDKYERMVSWPVNFIELPHSKKSQVEEVKLDETKSIISKIRKNTYVILLDVVGKQISSLEFSKLFSKQMMEGKDIDFIIGGAYGFNAEIYSKVNYRLSLSAMTLPHQLARLFLLEQIYRAESIIKNHPYHK